MQTELYSKVVNLLKEVERLDKFDAARQVEAFIESYMALKQADKYFGLQDLMNIKITASTTYASQNPSQVIEGKELRRDQDLFTAYCYFTAITMLLHSQGMMTANAKIKKD